MKIKRTRKHKNIILGLDLSLRATGICVLKGNIHHVSLIKSKIEGMERLAYIKKAIKNILYQNQWDIILIEGYSFGSRGRAIFSSGELGGIIKLLLYKYRNKDFLRVPTYIVPPTCLKKFITGKGNAPKDSMKMETLSKYNIKFEDNNECDAFGLAKMGEAYLTEAKFKYEKEALSSIELME